MADNIRATPRNEFLGLLADAMYGGLEYMKDPRRTQALQGLAGLLESTGIPKTTERMAYGEDLTNIGRANVPLLKPETAEAMMTVAPMAKTAGNAAKGVARMYGSEINAAMMGERGGLLGAITPQPMRVIELGPEFQGKRPPKIENLARTSDKFLFHSSTADKAKDLRYGIEPQAGGPWVREVAQGAVEGDIDNFFENVTPLAWFSDKPEWIKAMVGRKLNKSFDKVTADDIEKYGHLAFINKKSPSAENITYIPSEGLMEGSQSKVFDIQGNPKKAWETGLYQEGNFGQRLEPFGIERNEYVSPESIEPLLQLTGKDLVDFMKAKGLLEDNKFVPTQPTALNLAQQRSGLLNMTRTPSEAEIKKLSREDLINWLQNNDPNGQYLDPTPSPSISMYQTARGYNIEDAGTGKVFEFGDYNKAKKEFDALRYATSEFQPMTLQEAQESAINYLREFAQPAQSGKVLQLKKKPAGLLD